MVVKEATREECMTETRAKGGNLGAILMGWIEDRSLRGGTIGEKENLALSSHSGGGGICLWGRT